jgi:hypothetical protein
VNVVDSSGWLEYFADGPNADRIHEATLWTQDVDFRDVEGVRYLARNV